MNKSNLIWGIICLVIAGELAVANLTLPPEDLMFQIGDRNMPWIPPIVLVVIGIILLATVNQKGEEKMTEQTKVEKTIDPEKAAMNKRFETVGWGLLIVMLGGFMLIPETTVKAGFWSIGPEENVKDLAEIPDNVKNRLEIVPVKWIDKVLEVALERPPVPLTEEDAAAGPVKSGDAPAKTEVVKH